MEHNLKENARKGIEALVVKFKSDEKYYMDSSFDEANCKQIFITEFFRELGWDVYSKKPLPPYKREVWLEDTVEQGDKLKRVDYAFTINGDIKFFVEAKAPHVNLDGKKPIFQIKEYAWNAKVPIGILTDFQEFKVFDCRQVPNFENPKLGLIKKISCNYEDFLKHFDDIYDLLSYEAVSTGALNTFLRSTQGKVKGAEVDNLFLNDLSKWRLQLAQNIYKNSPTIEERDLDKYVQKILDRLVFVRIIEDRNIEERSLLEEFIGKKDIFINISKVFDHLDADYNGSLFKGSLPSEILVDDVVLEEILKELYPKYNLTCYRFDVIRVEILGQIYERFLGRQICISDKGEVTLEEKPSVRKAGGIFYTPKYIVDHVVENTIGKAVKGKSPKQIEKIKIVDPSCGSGSFLLGVYDYLIKYHGNYYKENPNKGENEDWYLAKNGKVNLTTKKKREILVNNIFGVDLDKQAVEVTQMSLYIKLLERESSKTMAQQLTFFKTAHLPDMTKNIKFGNSLISEGYDESIKWDREFPEVFKKGGFDFIVGNPPWGAELPEMDLEFLRKEHRRVVSRMIDSYIYFISLSINILNPRGVLGFVVPSTLINQVDAVEARELLLEVGLSEVINLGEKVFGPKVLNTTTIFITNPESNSRSKISLLDIRDAKTEDKGLLIKTGIEVPLSQWRKIVDQDPHKTFFLDDIAAISTLFRMRKLHKPLEDFIEGKIHRGVSPDNVDSHVLTPEQVKDLKIENEVLKNSISGSQIKNYSPYQKDQYIVYTTKKTEIDKYPNTKKWLKGFEPQITCKEALTGKHPKWALHRARDEKNFNSPKVIGLTTSKTIELVLDDDQELFRRLKQLNYTLYQFLQFQMTKKMSYWNKEKN